MARMPVDGDGQDARDGSMYFDERQLNESRHQAGVNLVKADARALKIRSKRAQTRARKVARQAARLDLFERKTGQEIAAELGMQLPTYLSYKTKWLTIFNEEYARAFREIDRANAAEVLRMRAMRADGMGVEALTALRDCVRQNDSLPVKVKAASIVKDYIDPPVKEPRQGAVLALSQKASEMIAAALVKDEPAPIEAEVEVVNDVNEVERREEDG